jgi:hypothetical protein
MTTTCWMGVRGWVAALARVPARVEAAAAVAARTATATTGRIQRIRLRLIRLSP